MTTIFMGITDLK